MPVTPHLQRAGAAAFAAAGALAAGFAVFPWRRPIMFGWANRSRGKVSLLNLRSTSPIRSTEALSSSDADLLLVLTYDSELTLAPPNIPKKVPPATVVFCSSNFVALSA